MNISEQDRERISAAIRAAEAKTSGEIVCVLAQTSSDATGAADPARGAGRARAAVAAGRPHRDDGSPHPVAAGRGVLRARRGVLPAAGARRAACRARRAAPWPIASPWSSSPSAASRAKRTAAAS